jgi:hypothetical protein
VAEDPLEQQLDLDLLEVLAGPGQLFRGHQSIIGQGVAVAYW